MDFKEAILQTQSQAPSGEEGYASSNEDFVDAPEKVESLPVSGSLVNDGDVEKGQEGVEGSLLEEKKIDSGLGEKVGEGAGIENLDVNGEVLDPKVLDSGGEGKIEENEYENGGNETNGLEGKAVSKDAVIESGEVDFDQSDGVKLTPEGDSVVGSVQVDVASPGVVVVGETAENDDDEVGGLKVEERGVSEELVEEEKKPEVVDDVEEAKLTPEGDAIVDTISVDVASPGVVVVGETEENGDANEDISEVEEVSGDSNRFEANIADAIADSENKPLLKEVGEADVFEPETSEEGRPNHDLKHTRQGDVVVDSVPVDVVRPGVAVVEYEEAENRVESVGEKIPVESDGGTIESKVRDEDDGKVITREAVIEPEAKSTTSDDVVVLKSVNDPTQKQDDEDVDDGMVDEAHTPVTNDSSVDNGKVVDVADKAKKSEIEPANIHEFDDDDAEPKTDIETRDYSMSDADDDDNAIFGSSEAAKKFIEELEQESSMVSHTIAEDSAEQPQIDGQIVTDSEEEGETDDDGEGKELFDSSALAALLKAATGVDSSDGGSITITSQDGSRLFTVERPAGLGSSLRSFRPASQTNRSNIFSSLTPSAGGGESEENLSEEEKKKLEKLQQIRVKFLRLVQRLGLSPEESVAAQVLYRLALLGGRHGSQTFSLDAAKSKALELEAEERDDLDFSINVLVLGKSGVGKSATINSLFGEEMTSIGSFEAGTASAKEISGSIDGINVCVIDTPGLKSSLMEQGFNRGVLSSVNKMMKKTPPDVVLYVDRLDSQTRDLNDLPLLRTVTSALGSSIWRNAIVTLTHGASAPPDGPSGTPLSYEVFVSQRSHVLQQSIGHAVGNLRMMSPSQMNPVSLVENHTSCRRNREGQKILPNGQSWRPQLLLLCYSMKILSEVSSLSKPQDPFDQRKLFGFQARAPPLPYMLSSMLQSRTHPKLPSDQGGDSVDSDIDLDDFSSSDDDEEDEYDQLPPFKPLKKAQLAKLTGEQRKAYFEEYDYRVKLLQKKQWRDELKRMKELKKKGKGSTTLDYAEDEDADSGAAAPVSVPLPDMALPPSFHGDNPAYRYRFLEPTSQFLVRPVLDSHGWDHDCGYDGVNVEHSLAIANRFPVVYTVQVTKDKKDFSLSLDSSIATKHGDNLSTMAGFDIQSMGKQLAYIVRGETKVKNLKKHKAAGGISFTFLGENVVPGVKIEDQITLGRQYVLVGSAGAVKSQQDTAYGANFEVQRREADYPIGQVQSSISMSIIKWRGDLALGFNGLAQLSVGRNSKVAVRAGINNKRSGQITVRTSSSEHLSLALAAIIPTVLSIYRKLFPVGDEKYSIY